MLGAVRRFAHLPTTLIADRRRASDLEAARQALLAATSSSDRDKELLNSASLEVHRGDTMYEPGRGRHYLSVGLSALRCLEPAIGPDCAPHSVLDFACGYGRVLRFLRVCFPAAEVTASEIDPVALDFCSRTFGARTLESTKALDRLSSPQRFDLIWCGSLLTHIDEDAAHHLLAFFREHLTDDGTCVLSAHGEVTVDGLSAGTTDYGLSPEARQEVLQRYDDAGYGYADYGALPGYGISIASREKLQTMAEGVGLREASYRRRGWDDHHDVYGFVRIVPGR